MFPPLASLFQHQQAGPFLFIIAGNFAGYSEMKPSALSASTAGPSAWFRRVFCRMARSRLRVDHGLQKPATAARSTNPRVQPMV